MGICRFYTYCMTNQINITGFLQNASSYYYHDHDRLIHKYGVEAGARKFKVGFG